MTHIMVDLETFGTKPGSVIRSLGACAFELEGDKPLEHPFYENIDHHSCLDAKLTVDRDTELWWQQQSQEAQDALTRDAKPLKRVLQAFTRFWTTQYGEFIWSHGAGFDIILLEAAYRVVGLTHPWKFYNARDTRTTFHLQGFDPKSVLFVGVKHNALDDATHQVKCIQQALLPPWRQR